MLNLPEDGKDYTGRLEVGEAIVKLQSRFQAPFTLKFPLEPCKDQFVTDAEIRAHMSTFNANPGIESRGISDTDIFPDIPQADKKDELTEKEKELLKSIWEEPYNSTVKKYQRMGVSRRQGQKLRQGLIAKGLIKKAPCMVPEGQIVLMEITANGRKILAEIGVDTSKYNPREGGAVHRYWVERMADQYRQKGWHVRKEVPVNDRIIDVVAQSPEGRKVGIEIMRKGNTCDVVEFEL